MANHIPRHALSFMANSAKLAARYGLREGVARAAAKANPVLLVLEAAVSVAYAVDSYLTLRTAREHRDGLRRLIPQEAERLRLEREHLEEALDLARAEIDQRDKIQQRLGALALSCCEVCRLSWAELHTIRTSDLPDLNAFDTAFDALEVAWAQLQRALANFNAVST